MSNHELMSIDDQTALMANIMNKRHRSGKSIIKNPPQPRFCIKNRTLDGRDLYINVLSYSRIANQLSEFDPIPLYGGMQIRSYGSIKNAAHIQQPSPPQLIFAVMASPEVLKNTGRSCADSPEQMNLVELMCEFVEAMNPGIVLSKKPEILRDRDLAGELKDVWSAVQNFRDKEKAGISDIVVYTEFGPDSAPESIVKTIHRNEPNNGNPVKSEIHEANKLDQYSESQNDKEKGDDDAEGDEESAAEKEKSEDVAIPEKCVDELDAQTIEIDKLALEDKKDGTKHHEANQNNEKIVKIQNQKNKESQHHFLKFLSSSKEKEAKEKEKEKQQDEPEPKSKTKKSLNFFRRNKSSASSPTHTSNNNVNSIEKNDSNAEH